MAAGSAPPPPVLLVEGQTELRYLEAFFVAFGLPAARVVVVPQADPRALVQAARRSAPPGSEPWLHWDVDPQAGAVRARQLRAALAQARQLAFRVTLSHPCFEVWLWQHLAPSAASTGPLLARQLSAMLERRLPGGYRKGVPFDPAWLRATLPRPRQADLSPESILRQNPASSFGQLLAALRAEARQ